jgi:ribosomal protein S8
METSLIGKALAFGSKECRFEPYVSKLKNAQNLILNSYNISVKKKSTKIKVVLTRINKELVKKLTLLGLLNSYSIDYRRKVIVIFPSYFKFIPYVSKIKAVSRGNKVFNITLKGLSILNKLSGASIIIIASDKGFLTSEEALIKKTGGKIILSAY